MTSSDDQVVLSIQIVSCRNLIVGDKTSSDPYVKVYIGDKDLHETKHMLKTLNPVFSTDPHAKASFRATLSKHDLVKTGGLLFKVKDWDRIGSNDTLGTVVVPSESILGTKGGDEVEWKLDPPEKKKGVDAGCITIRCTNESYVETPTTIIDPVPAAAAPVAAVTEEAAKKEEATIKKEESSSAAPPSAPASQPPPVLMDEVEEEEEARPQPQQAVSSTKNDDTDEEKNAQGAAAAAVPEGHAQIEIKIVSCRNLIVGDKTSSDPYVKVYMGEDNLHETKHVLKTTNPVFTDKDKSSFRFTVSEKDLYAHGGLVFKVKDWDAFGSNDTLGSVRIPPGLILDSDGNLERKLDPPDNNAAVDAGFITIRCKNLSNPDSVSTTRGGIEDESAKTTTSVASSKPPPLAKKEENKVNLSSVSENDDGVLKGHVRLSIKIVSCQNLIVGDKTTSDPYVKVKLGDDDLHETKHVLKTTNPVFTNKDRSSFQVTVLEKDLYEEGGLIFKVKDWDMMGSNDTLGSVRIPPRLILDSDGRKEVERKLDPPDNKTGVDAGSITICCENLSKTIRGSSRGIGDEVEPSAESKAEEPSKKTPKPGEKVDLLIEIVSCWDLIAGDMKTSDAYVKAKFGGEDVHETKPVNETCDPIFTVKSDNLFILSALASDLFDNGGVYLKVKDYDPLPGSNDTIGTALIPAQDLYDASGKRLELKLDPPSGKEGKEAGFIAIRSRPATDYDKQFLDGLKQKKDTKDFLGLESGMSKIFKPSGGKKSKAGMFGSYKKTVKAGPDKGVTKYLVRPGPDESDPKRKEETEWMSHEKIEEEAMKESLNWLDVGSGELGKVHLEIIGADGLPNKDSGLSKNKTDSFIAIVYEDCMAKTDVIDDCLSPRWLPWTQRAFTFRMMHSSSELLIGVFDSDTGVGNDHDVVGRVSVDLSNLVPNTQYLLQYNIYENAKLSERIPRGMITLRLRIEFEDERRVLMSNLEYPPAVYVNVRSKEDFRVVRRTIGGKYDVEQYSMKTINSYVDELRAYKHMFHYVKDAAINVIFWRGHFPLHFPVPGSPPKDAGGDDKSFMERYFKWSTVYLPLHSLNVFVACVILAERPSLGPSFFFLGFASMLLGVMGYRRNTPNPWAKCKSFAEFLQVLILGHTLTGGASIAKHENEEEALKFREKWETRIKEAEEAAAIANEKLLKEQEEYEAQMAEIGDVNADTDISTKTDEGGLSISPFKAILYPIQKYLAMACEWTRFVRNIFIWEECYYSFWLTAASLSLGVIFFFVPWAFLIKWGSRIIVWTLLGPHMRLVDIFWYSKIPELTEAELKQQEEEEKRLREEAAEAAAADARRRREEAAQLKDMKSVLYGNYMTKVPILKCDRFRDTPLHTSMATPYNPDPDQLSTQKINSERVAGQKLVGSMIPKLQTSSVSDTPKKGNQGGGAPTYVTVAAAAVTLALLSWFSLPIVAPSLGCVTLPLQNFWHSASDTFEDKVSQRFLKGNVSDTDINHLAHPSNKKARHILSQLENLEKQRKKLEDQLKEVDEEGTLRLEL